MLGPMKPFNTIGQAEIIEAMGAMPLLSGYLAGRERGGHFVCALEDVWAATFKVKHAIAVNSATSGLLAAAFAVGLQPGHKFICPAMTMSATAAAPMFTGATPYFCDVSELDFGIDDHDLPYDVPIFVTNLFGHPATLTRLRRWCNLNKTYLIEDNAQSPFAMEDSKYAGTIGHIGVFSLNVHKHMQCGEGGIVTTDDDELAARLRAFINHGEHTGGSIGLNLRMPEVSAAIALWQLRRGQEIVSERMEQAQEILAAIGPIPGIRPPIIREGCVHVFYTIPFLLEMRAGTADSDVNAVGIIRKRRTRFFELLHDQEVPIVEGYVPPLYRMPAFKPYARPCPVAEQLHDETLFYFENCAWDPTSEQIRQIGDAFKRAAEKMNA